MAFNVFRYFFEEKFTASVNITAITPAVWSPSAILLPENTAVVSLTSSTAFLLPQKSDKVFDRSVGYTKTFVEFLLDQELEEVPNGEINAATQSDFMETDVIEASAVVGEIWDTEYLNFSSDIQTVETSSKGLEKENESTPFVSGTIIDTTAEVDKASDEKALQLVLTAVDVVFFLVEALIKAAIPIILGGGSQAMRRAKQALDIGKVKLRPVNDKEWELLDCFSSGNMLSND